MKYLNLIIALTVTLFLSSGCEQSIEEELLSHGQTIDLRNEKDPTRRSVNRVQLLEVWQDFMRKNTPSTQRGFYGQNGLFDWSEAQLIQSTERGNYLMSIPTRGDSTVNSILFAWKFDDEIRYFHVSKADLARPTKEIIDEYGVHAATAAAATFLKHEHELNAYYSGFLLKHLTYPEVRLNADMARGGGGWCLIEVELYNPPELDGDIPGICNCNYYNSLTQHTVMNPPADFDPAQDDPTWLEWHPAQQTSWTINYGDPNIQGDYVGDGITVYHFWAWCPDDENQVTDGNFTTNISNNGNPTGGPGTPTTSPPTCEEVQDANWVFYIDNYNDPFTGNIIQSAVQTFLGESGLSFQEFISIGGLSCIQTETTDDLIIGATLNESCTTSAFYNCNTDLQFFYNSGISVANVNWLENHSLHHNSIINFINNYSNNPDALLYINEHIERMRTDLEYKAFVEASFGWSPIMWEIAKELIGEKVVDIVFRFIPGFGQADNVKDAIKALNSGDWPTLIYEVTQLVVGNSPVGQWLKAWQAVNEIRDLVKKAGRIWDKIENFSDAAVQRLWDIAKNSPLKFNEKYLKYVGDLETPRLGNATRVDYRKTFDEAFPDVRTNTPMQVHHAVPQAAMSNYPQLNIGVYQMHSLENLRGIPTDAINPTTGTNLHQSITNQWGDFYQQHSNAGTLPTMQDIFDFTKQIDDQYGHLFEPVIR